MIRNQLYPYIEKYINDYLYGFNKEQMNLAITEGKLELNKINIRPDAINKEMDNNNIPFWLKSGLINKIYVGCSLMNLIGEIPLEATIDGLDVILSPSYKWINHNLELIANLGESIKNNNPIGLDLNANNNRELKFDTSVFNKSFVEEVFKDKSIVSNLANSLIKSLYDFYKMVNYAALIKIKNLHIRIEDDELFNYEGKFVLGITIENLVCKMGFKGSQKKNSLKIENFSVYWENQPKLTISNEILNNYMKAGKIEKDYYNEIGKIKFNLMSDSSINPNLKLIIDNFSMKINFGTLNEETGNADIFNIQDNLKKCYFQISSNELVINIYPEFLNAINHFTSFSSNFAVIEKIQKYRPKERPFDKNKNDKISNNRKKEIVKEWLQYFIWRRKILNKVDYLVENPFRAEFNRFYNIYHKRVDVFKLIEKLKEKKETENKNKNIEEIKEENEDNSNINNINNEENAQQKDAGNTTPNQDNIKESKISEINDEIYTFDKYISKYGGDKNNDKSKKVYEEYVKQKLKKKYSNFSSIIEIKLKGFIINIHPSLNRNIDLNNNIVINTQGIEIKIQISSEQFNFNFGVNSLDIGQKDIIYGERIILCPTSYRTDNTTNQSLANSKSNIFYTPTNNLSSLYEAEKREAGLSGLLKKFNPNHEVKIKIIDDALSKVGDEPKFIFKRNYNEYNNNERMTTLRAKPPNALLNSNASMNGTMPFGMRRTYISKYGDNYGEQNNYYNNYYTNIKPRNSSFAKTIIENYNETDLRFKQKLKKQKNELSISQAINDYNSNNNKRKSTPLKDNMRYSSVGKLEISTENIKLKSKNKLPYRDNILKTNNNKNNNNSPLNLIELYSNTKIGALKMKYIKHNNSFSLDEFSIQLGTIRLHPFPQYLIDMITIYLDYTADKSSPKITRSQVKSTDGGGMEGTKQLLKMRQEFYQILIQIPNFEKSESIKEYINHLDNEIQNLLKFSEEIDIYPFFEMNYLFSYFPKGIKFYFDYENIECVYYNKTGKMLGKFMISPYNINISISLSKISIHLLGINIEIDNLKESKSLVEKLMEKCQRMLNEKKEDIVELVIEPCYTAIKDELVNDGRFDGDIFKNINDSKKSSVKRSINKLPSVNRK